MANPGGGGGSPTSHFAVSEFMSKVDGMNSFAKRNRFTVEITPPTSLTSATGVEDVPPENVEFLVKTVSFPSRTFGTTNLRYGGKYSMELPYETTSEGVALTFLETNNWNCRKFWYNWLEYIQSVESYNMKYYDDYKGTIKISVYDESDREAVNPKHRVSLINAFPKGMSAIELGWENAELLDFGVDIIYKKWEIEI